ncbi:hypothetical protein BH23THE1_BH23THE1_24800 [soil metagenome]
MSKIQNTNSVRSLSITVTIMAILVVSGFASYDVFAQANNSGGGSQPAPNDQLQGAEFSQIVLSSTQIDELSSTVNNATQAAEEEGNMTKVIIQLKVLQNQLDFIKQDAAMVGP